MRPTQFSSAAASGLASNGVCRVNATATAPGALLGFEVHELEGGAWLLRHASGACIGVVHRLDPLAVAVRSFEAAHADGRELVQRRGGPA